MGKWADYLISGIWMEETNSSRYISHVFIHEDSEANFSTGSKFLKDDVIKLLKNSKKIITIKWDYNEARWVSGAKVTYEKINNVEYLRTLKDATVTDNLDNLIRASVFIK